MKFRRLWPVIALLTASLAAPALASHSADWSNLRPNRMDLLKAAGRHEAVSGDRISVTFAGGLPPPIDFTISAHPISSGQWLIEEVSRVRMSERERGKITVRQAELDAPASARLRKLIAKAASDAVPAEAHGGCTDNAVIFVESDVGGRHREVERWGCHKGDAVDALIDLLVSTPKSSASSQK